MIMTSIRSRALGASAAAAVFVLAFVRASGAPRAPRFVVPEAPSASLSGKLAVESRVASSGSTAEVHSATAVETTAGDLRAFWYGGSREGAKDVAIYTALYDTAKGKWGEEAIVTTREDTASELARPIRKLGNPMAMRDGKGRLLLFYVSVSVGGWSGSAINLKVSEDDGRSFSDAVRLVTSPFSNISTLVRAPGVLFDDGSIGVPAYHELIGKYGELLRVSESGAVWSKSRIGWGRSVLQPVLVPVSPKRAIVLLRQSGASEPRVYRSETVDGGRSFSAPVPTSLKNPDAGIAAISLGGERLLVAFNDSEIDRSNLKLACTDDGGRSFRIVYEVELGRLEASRLAYPALVRTHDGSLHLLFTWDRTEIRHLRFSGDWMTELGP